MCGQAIGKIEHSIVREKELKKNALIQAYTTSALQELYQLQRAVTALNNNSSHTDRTGNTFWLSVSIRAFYLFLLLFELETCVAFGGL